MFDAKSKLHSTCLDEHFDGIRFYKEKKLSSFSNNGRKNSGFVSKLFKRVCHKCNVRFHWNLLREIIPFGEIGFSNHFETLSKKFSAVFQKVVGGVIKTAFYVSIGTTWWKKFRSFSLSKSDNGRNFFFRFSEKVGGDLRTAF